DLVVRAGNRLAGLVELVGAGGNEPRRRGGEHDQDEQDRVRRREGETRACGWLLGRLAGDPGGGGHAGPPSGTTGRRAGPGSTPAVPEGGRMCSIRIPVKP